MYHAIIIKSKQDLLPVGLCMPEWGTLFIMLNTRFKKNTNNLHGNHGAANEDQNYVS